MEICDSNEHAESTLESNGLSYLVGLWKKTQQKIVLCGARISKSRFDVCFYLLCNGSSLCDF